jgi:hypothetical protein
MLRFGPIAAEPLSNVTFPVLRHVVDVGPGVRLRVPLVNGSEHATYHVIACPRHVSYDPEARTLRVEFASRTPPAPTRRFFLPEMLAVLPQQQATLTATIEHRLLRAAIVEGRISHAHMDISDWAHLALSVAFDMSPFRIVHGHTGSETWEEFHRWGRLLETRVERAALTPAA